MSMKLDIRAIQIIMAERQMTRAQLADDCSMCRQNISTILNRGTCALKTAGKLAKGLGVPVSQIMKEE